MDMIHCSCCTNNSGRHKSYTDTWNMHTELYGIVDHTNMGVALVRTCCCVFDFWLQGPC